MRATDGTVLPVVLLVDAGASVAMLCSWTLVLVLLLLLSRQCSAWLCYNGY